ncbi:hypothetical protein O6P43_009849 [Quillaja saponaria]|uniref:Uncharacterized protein n=1 Tax=Quillaja saponaria TaxID=32244 RepID=A0AAD7PZB2_QUISA|nr:hypothetical protein O6P43_009849 [Quillaja saponaria]
MLDGPERETLAKVLGRFEESLPPFVVLLVGVNIFLLQTHQFAAEVELRNPRFTIPCINALSGGFGEPAMFSSHQIGLKKTPLIFSYVDFAQNQKM